MRLVFVCFVFFCPLYILKINTRNKTKALDGLYMYLFDFMNLFSARTLSFIFSLLRLDCSRKRTELGVRRFKFWFWFHHIMAVMILAKFELLKGRQGSYFIHFNIPNPYFMLDPKHSFLN